MVRKGSIITDKELENEDKQNTHNRRQKLFDALTNVAITAIYLIPIILILFYIIILTHKITIKDWLGLENDIKSMIIPITAYFVGVMSKSGLLPK